MAITASNDFLRFSAYSIKDLITRKLSEDGSFTDQVYEGSNLAILIDIVSYMYQCLIYNLNTAAAESMFSDTQIYENISRLCKFIGYHPAAYKPSSITIAVDQVNNSSDSTLRIYPCTAFDTGLYDSDSNKIFFSTTFGQMSNVGSPITVNERGQTLVTLVNGRWKHYATVFTAAGIDYETFVLDGLKSNSIDKKYVANDGIQVIVIPNGKDLDDLDQTDILWHCDPNEIFIQAYDSQSISPTFSKLYNNTDKVYTAYLNEDKTFEIKFGNGISGRKLQPGDQVHVMYLDTNGPDGFVDVSEIEDSFGIPQHSPGFFGISNELYKAIFKIEPDDTANIANAENVATSIVPSTLSQPVAEQNVDQVREYAPSWFKTGNRLITKDDYEFIFKGNAGNTGGAFNGIVDVVCMNNWEYVVSLYRWLYNMGINPVEEVFNAESNASLDDDDFNKRKKDPFRYMSKVRLIQSGYQFVDSADGNNIYLWIASSDNKDMKIMKQDIDLQLNTIKTMTSEAYPLKPIDVYFDLSFTPSQLYYDNLVKDDGSCLFDATNSYLEVTISDNSIFSNISIANKVESIIKDAFDVKHCKLGQAVDYSIMLDQIYQINGVIRVRTIYYPENYLESNEYDTYKSRACDGIAFASWSSTELIDVGDDLQISNTIRTLEKFQFPKLAPGLDISKKIKVIRKSMNTVNPVKF